MINRTSDKLSDGQLHKIKIITLLAVLSLVLVNAPSRAQLSDANLEWKLKRDRKNIQVYLGKVPDSKFRAVFSVMTIEADIESLVALVMDLDNCSEWASMCKEARVHERVSPTETYVYSLNDAPFPVRDRDVLAKVEWSYDKATGKVSMLSRAVDGLLPKKTGVVRVINATSEWHFTLEENGMVMVENYAHVDPNGAVPAWLVNALTIDSPYKTFKQMRAQIKSGKYDNADVAFLPEI